MPNSTGIKPVVYCTRSRYHKEQMYLIAIAKGGKQWNWQRYAQEKLTLQIIKADSWREANLYAQKWFGVGIGGSRGN